MVLYSNQNLTQNSIKEQSLDDIYGTFVPYHDVHFIVDKFKSKYFRVLKDIDIIALSRDICQEDILSRIKLVTGMRVAYRTLSAIFSLTKGERRVLNTMIKLDCYFEINRTSQTTIANISGYKREFVNRTLSKLKEYLLIVKVNRELGQTCVYMVNTIFQRQDVRQLFIHLLPSLKSLPERLVTRLYKNKLTQIISFAKNVATDALTFHQLYPSLAFIKEQKTLDPQKPQGYLEPEDFLQKGAEYVNVTREDELRFDKLMGVDMEISPVIDAITEEQLPLTLAGRVCLSKYPDPAIAHGLSLLKEGQFPSFKVVKDGAWEYVRANHLRLLKDKFEHLKELYNISPSDPLFKKAGGSPKAKNEQKAIVNKHTNPDYVALYEEFEERRIDGREAPAMINPFSARKEGQSQSEGLNYVEEQEKERQAIIEQRKNNYKAQQLKELAKINAAHFKAYHLTTEPLNPIPFEDDGVWEEIL